jgi:hypothetical protein
MTKLKNGLRSEKNGWIYLSVRGTAMERGYAHGYLVLKEVNDIFKMLEFFFMQEYGYTIDFFTDIIGELYGPTIQQGYPEVYEEMQGIVKGLNAAGGKYSIADIVMWNCFISIGYMVGALDQLIQGNEILKAKYVHKQHAAVSQEHFGKGRGGGGGSNATATTFFPNSKGGAEDRCTAFIAVGSYTHDGKIVCAHNSFDNFIAGQYYNMILDIKPVKGNRMLMQTCPGWIWSGTDFYVTSAGLICTETTIGGFNQFALKDPVCCRIRQAMQYAKILDDVLPYLTKNNGGDYANSWLLGDTKSNTIMRIELGLEYVNVEKKTDGYFIGFNGPYDPRIRNLECTNTGHYDIRRHQGARKVRLTQLMEQHKGTIDVKIGQDILGDHFDVYLNKINPCSRTCCSHYDLDDRAFMSDPSRPKPYQPRGAVDGVVSDSTMIKAMVLSCRWGSSCGLAFDKTDYFKKNINWQEYEPYIKDRPSQPWTDFTVTHLPVYSSTNSISKSKGHSVSVKSQSQVIKNTAFNKSSRKNLTQKKVEKIMKIKTKKKHKLVTI